MVNCDVWVVYAKGGGDVFVVENTQKKSKL